VNWFDGATQLNDHRCRDGGLIKIIANLLGTINCLIKKQLITCTLIINRVTSFSFKEVCKIYAINYPQLTLVLHDYVLHYQAHSTRNKMQDLNINTKFKKQKSSDRKEDLC
jgi:hypothetical protein